MSGALLVAAELAGSVASRLVRTAPGAEREAKRHNDDANTSLDDRA